MPLGPRRGCSYRRKSISKRNLSKKDVESIITSGNFECEYRMANQDKFVSYDGCVNNLIMILNDQQTSIKVADARYKVFKSGYKTIIMNATCFPAVLLIRSSK